MKKSLNIRVMFGIEVIIPSTTRLGRFVDPFILASNEVTSVSPSLTLYDTSGNP